MGHRQKETWESIPNTRENTCPNNIQNVENRKQRDPKAITSLEFSCVEGEL